MNIYKLLDEIRRRTGMYIGTQSPTHLRSFLCGFGFAEYIYETPPPKEVLPDFGKFHDWVAQKFNYYESTSGWANMIEDQREDKNEALHLFYSLLDEYRGLKPKVFCRLDFDPKYQINTLIYTRYKKVYGTCDRFPKPIPNYLQIEEALPHNEYVALVAYNDKHEILEWRGEDDILKAKQRALDLLGVPLADWEK